MRSSAVALVAALLASLTALAAEDYDPSGRRDPFEPAIVVTPAPVWTSALERHELSQIRVEGVITGISDARATLRVPGGESFVVRAGDRVGRQGGRVARISSSEVVVREESRDADGVLLVRETALRL